MSSTGFVNISTRPAGANSVSVPELGTFAPLAAPVVAANGTVLLGTIEGRLWARHADGSPYWNRQLGRHEQIATAPAVASDGSVHVVGVRPVRDHRAGGTGVEKIEAKLYRFTAGGGAPGGGTPFPQYGSGARIVGPPSIWRSETAEAVIVPVSYAFPSAAELHLLAFSLSGALIADGIVSQWRSGDVTGGGWKEVWDLFGSEFIPGTIPPPAAPPYPAVGIARHSAGGSGILMVCDRYHSRMVGVSFCIGPDCSPAPGFSVRFGLDHGPRTLLSSPVALPSLHTVVGTDRGAIFSGPAPDPPAAIANRAAVYATPTIAAAGRLVVVNMYGEVSVWQGGTVTSTLNLTGGSIARAAASRNHVFVATTNGLYTLDAAAERLESTFPWVGGGIWSPAIGTRGHVYAIASNILFVFPAPRILDPTDGRGGPGDNRDPRA
jgi:hypothetical protein